VDYHQGKNTKKCSSKAVQKKTDSLYRITYEKSEIDEVAGNAYLYNVQVKIDSAQWAKLIEKDSMPSVTMAVTIAKITIRGLAELKLIEQQFVGCGNYPVGETCFSFG
jgi:hypothetical protein